MHLSLAPERTDDSAAVAAVLREAFDTQPGVVDMVEAVRASSHYEPALTIVARSGSSAVGFVMISHAALVDDAGVHRDVLTLSPLAVLPDHRHQGVGSALVRDVLERAEARHDLPRLVTLEGDPGFYERLGFDFARGHGVEFDLPDWAPATAAQVFRLTGHDPALRGRVTYPPAFALVDG